MDWRTNSISENSSDYCKIGRGIEMVGEEDFETSIALWNALCTLRISFSYCNQIHLFIVFKKKKRFIFLLFHCTLMFFQLYAFGELI